MTPKSIFIFRKICYALLILFYFVPLVQNFFLYGSGAFLASIGSYILFLFSFSGIVLIYFIAEPVDHFRNVVIIITVISVFSFPFINKAISNHELYKNFKSREKELKELVQDIEEYGEIKQMVLHEHGGLFMLNFEFSNSYENILDTLNIDESKFENIRAEMKKARINSFKTERNSIILYHNSILPKFIYNSEKSPGLIDGHYNHYDIYLDTNWYAIF
ncbi:MAG: hypothetical protein K8I03_04085 [Ignavibacteria bacterium]|nr:hypothetical protein [Ignavibacteria bacterium]